MPTADPVPRGRPPGTTNTDPHAGAGNQNARTHGWFSQHNPAPIGDILAAGRDAVARRDLRSLRGVARALAARGYRSEAGKLRAIAARLEILLTIADTGEPVTAARLTALLDAVGELPYEADTTEPAPQ